MAILKAVTRNVFLSVTVSVVVMAAGHAYFYLLG